MFKKYLEELINAKTDEEVNSIFYGENGIDRAFQNDKLTAKELTILTDLTNKLSKLLRGVKRMFSDDTARKTKELLDFWQMEEMEIEGELIKIGYDEEVEKMLINENEHILVNLIRSIRKAAEC